MAYSGIKSIFKNTFYLSAARGITAASRAVYAILLANFLGAELYGIFNYGYSWYLLFVPASVFGLDLLIIKEIGRNKNNSLDFINHTLGLRSVSSILISLICFALGYLIESDSQIRLLLGIFSIALFGRGLSLWSHAVFKGYESSQFVFYQETSFRLLEVIIGVGLLVSGFNIIALATSHAVIWLLQGMVSFILIKQKLHLTLKPVWNSNIALQLIKKSFPIFIAALALMWILQGPIIMYRYHIGFAESVGILALAIQAFSILGSIFTEIGSAAVPVLSRSIERSDGKSGHYINAVLEAGLVLGGILIICAITFGEWLISLIFNPEYNKVAFYLPWVLSLIIPYFWVTTLSGVILAKGSLHALMHSSVLGAIIFTISSTIFIDLFGIMGVIISLAFGLFTVFLYQLWVLLKYYDIEFRTSLLIPSIVSLISIITTITINNYNAWLAFICGASIILSFTIMLGIKKVNAYLQ